MIKNILAILLGGALVLPPPLASTAQTSGQDVPRFKLQGPAEQSGAATIRDALNRPCLDVEAGARARVVNRHLFDHIISIKNRCPRLIKVKACYQNSGSCKSADVGAYQREDLILGTMPNVVSFRYSLVQK